MRPSLATSNAARYGEASYRSRKPRPPSNQGGLLLSSVGCRPALLIQLNHFQRCNPQKTALLGCLAETAGAGESVIVVLKSVQAAALKLMREDVMDKPILASWEKVLAYCRATMGYGREVHT